MPLIVMCGLPCSGKTTRAKQLASALEQHIAIHNANVALLKSRPPVATGKKPPPPPITYQPKVIIVSEESLLIVRGESYKDAGEEKKVRGALMSAVERYLARDTVVVLDSMNYIKGFRYQLHCVAKEARTTHCVYYCMVSSDTCREWNQARSADPIQDTYPPEVLESLLTRLEEPNALVRWDHPLFTSIADDPTPPLHTLIPAMIPPVILPSSTPTSTTPTHSTTDLTPNQSTKTRPIAEAGYLEGLDLAVKAVSESVMLAVRDGMAGECIVPVGLIGVDGKTKTLKVTVMLPSRGVSVSEMGRMRRRFLSSLNRLDSGLSREDVAVGFAEYLGINLK
ncbi:hypothetical protein HDU67_002159 [Dinochytrium kinnereticum]|nr:hypothetical protein HDU67_002159 [Dinochytrium kinnereticum]